MSPIWDIQCFGVVSAVMVFADYLLVITFLPAACIVPGKVLPATVQGLLHEELRLGTGRCRRRLTIKWTRCGRRDAKAPRFVEMFYGGPFADFVIKGKIPLTVLFCLILVSSDGRLEPAAGAGHLGHGLVRLGPPLHAARQGHEVQVPRGSGRTRRSRVGWSPAFQQTDPWELTGGAHPACIEDGYGETLDGKSCVLGPRTTRGSTSRISNKRGSTPRRPMPPNCAPRGVTTL